VASLSRNRKHLPKKGVKNGGYQTTRAGCFKGLKLFFFRKVGDKTDDLVNVKKIKRKKKRSAPPTNNLYTCSKKYQQRRYFNIVKMMHLVEIKLYNQ
jgi:hypothetical protein